MTWHFIHYQIQEMKYEGCGFYPVSCDTGQKPRPNMNHEMDALYFM